MKLIYKELAGNNVNFGTRINGAHINAGDEVHLGDNVLTSRGERAVVNHFVKPHKPSSSGKISVQMDGSNHSTEFYVSVIGAEWIDREDRFDNLPNE